MTVMVRGAAIKLEFTSDENVFSASDIRVGLQLGDNRLFLKTVGDGVTQIGANRFDVTMLTADTFSLEEEEVYKFNAKAIFPGGVELPITLDDGFLTLLEQQNLEP